ncbi:MAG: flagellar basal body P-ring protein FlgI [Planctomycetes bacterium]|nr:flagellar basal body P-ring protein FlgI [Planctomycetota bacterium]
MYWKTLAAFGLLAACGCTGLSWSPSTWTAFRPLAARSQSPEDGESAETLATELETPMIGDRVSVTGLNVIVLEGVGLVTGLDGTGSDPPPSVYREKMLEEMRRRNIKDPNSILRSPNTALVVVRAYLPPLVRKGERFDVEVRVPGDSETTSLNGGWLMATFLAEQALVPGEGVLEGHVYAQASGPVLISTGEGDEASLAGVLRRGRVLGGGVSLKERDLALHLRSDYVSFRNAMQIADQIGKRFFGYNAYGLREPLADAKTNKRIELKVLPRYKDNYPRYLQVIRHMAFQESDVARGVRLARLKDQLAVPETSRTAALELEAIGPEAIPVLKTGLKSPSLEVRFHTASALAYLGDAAGIPALAEAAREEPAFRVFAFAAMAAVESAEANMALRELLNGTSAETRYGALRALTTLDPNDPFIRGEKLNDEFMLHVLDVEGEPMIHLTRRLKAEVAVFGADQRFRTPLAVQAGSRVWVNARAGDDTVTLSRFAVGQLDQRRTVSTRVADVIRAAAELGATYPDIAQMLVQAEKQHNLPGRIELDALPRAGRVYERPEVSGGEALVRSQARIGNRGQTPNLFGSDDGGGESADGAEAETEADNE